MPKNQSEIPIKEDLETLREVKEEQKVDYNAMVTDLKQ